jgi:hypothetical protein
LLLASEILFDRPDFSASRKGKILAQIAIFVA